MSSFLICNPSVTTSLPQQTERVQKPAPYPTHLYSSILRALGEADNI